ncbi:MAG: ABC transporter substrate-binding protein [Alistipes sp.]|nr:ABC transporter substrate-binding protein [Candidatus Alistipes equi]
MKKIIVLLVAVLMSIGANAEKIIFMPQWTPQAQFAGFYVAKEMGFYEKEGLDIEIKHISSGSSKSALTELTEGKVHILGQQLIPTIKARSKGIKLLNILQITQRSGLMCVSHTPLSGIEELNNMKIGNWKANSSEFCDIIESYKHLNINWVTMLNGISLYIHKVVDATLCFSYNEYISLLLAVGDIPKENILYFYDYGYKCPEDGLIVMEAYYNKNKDVIDRFVKATKRGWNYARTHRHYAVDVSMKYCKENHIITNRAKQEMMLDEYLALQINPMTGEADFAPVDEMTFNDIVNALLMTNHITVKTTYKEVVR